MNVSLDQLPMVLNRHSCRRLSVSSAHFSNQFGPERSVHIQTQEIYRGLTQGTESAPLPVRRELPAALGQPVEQLLDPVDPSLDVFADAVESHRIERIAIRIHEQVSLPVVVHAEESTRPRIGPSSSARPNG